MPTKIIPESKWEGELNELGPWEAAQGGGVNSPLNNTLQKLANRAEFIKNLAYSITAPPWTQEGANAPTPVYMNAATNADNGAVISVGGLDSTDTPIGDVVSYHPKGGVSSSLGPINPAMLRAIAKSKIDGDIMVGPGIDTQVTRVPVTDCYLIDGNLGVITPISPPTSGAGAGMLYFCADGVFRYFGGILPNGSLSTAVEAYDIPTNTWTVETNTTIPVYGASAVMTDNSDVVIIGGYDAAGLTNIQLYNTPYDMSSVTIGQQVKYDGATVVNPATVTRISASVYKVNKILVTIDDKLVEYSYTSNGWTPLVDGPNGISPGITVSGPYGKVMSIGGKTATGTVTDEVYTMEI